MALSGEELLIRHLAPQIILTRWNWEPIGYAEKYEKVAGQAYQVSPHRYKAYSRLEAQSIRYGHWYVNPGAHVVHDRPS